MDIDIPNKRNANIVDLMSDDCSIYLFIFNPKIPDDIIDNVVLWLPEITLSDELIYIRKKIRELHQTTQDESFDWKRINLLHYLRIWIFISPQLVAVIVIII